jgi:hypothetical protein
MGMMIEPVVDECGRDCKGALYCVPSQVQSLVQLKMLMVFFAFRLIYSGFFSLMFHPGRTLTSGDHRNIGSRRATSSTLCVV